MIYHPSIEVSHVLHISDMESFPEKVQYDLEDLKRTNCESFHYDWFTENDGKMYPSLNEFLLKQNVTHCVIRL